MAKKVLVKYIKDQLSRGYDPKTIKNYLVRYGYNAEDVDGALKNIYSPEVRHVIHLSPATMIGVTIIFVVLIVVGVVFFNFLGSKTPQQLLDLNIETGKNIFNPGESLSIITELSNIGSKKRYDVNVEYQLINQQTNKLITLKQETIGIETRSSKSTNAIIPSDALPGNYILRAIATYNGNRAVSTLPIRVESAAIEEECNKDETFKCNDGSIITVRECVDNKFIETDEVCLEETGCVVDLTKKCNDGSVIVTSKCINGILERTDEVCKDDRGAKALTTFEILEKVEDIAKQNRLEAENLCKSLEFQTSKDLCFNKMGEILGDSNYCQKINDDRTKDVCLSNVAKITDNSAICEQISKDSRKDSCYMNFVIDKKDYTVCSKVVNQYLRQSCESLNQLSKLNLTDVAFYEALINQSLFLG